MDRRKRKTQNAIMSTFMELMAKKDVEKISISEIAEMADVSRGTFYLHYIDKYDLLEKCIESSFDDLERVCETTNSFDENMFEVTFDYFDKQKDTLKIIWKADKEQIFKRKLSARISTNIQTVMPNMDEVGITFITAGVIGVIDYWFNNDNIAKEILSQRLSNVVKATV